MKKAEGAKNVLKKVINVILTIFLIFSLCTTILAISSNSNGDGVPNFLGYSLMAVESDSMEPTIMTGDLIIVGLFDTEEEKQCIQVGDIITFVDTDLSENGVVTLNTHRVVEVVTGDDGKATGYITKGDNAAASADTTVRQIADVRGIYETADESQGGIRISGLGYFLNFLFSSVGFLVCILIPLIFVFIYEIVSFVKAAIKIKNRDKKLITAEDEEAIKQAAIEEYLRKQQGQAAGEAAAVAPESKPEEPETPVSEE